VTGWLPREAAEIFGEGATAEEAYDLLTVDVPPESWLAALTTARDELGCTFFDWLSAVDEPGTGFRVCVHVAALEGGVRRLLLRTTVGHDDPALPTATGVYTGAGWHERETHEMFGVAFTGHPGLAPLLLPEEFEGYPLRKDFVLASRVVKAWPGAKEPGESHDGGPKRRQMQPPGVPDPNEWGPLKGQLPPAPARPARAARGAAAGDRPARTAPGERPARRTRSASEGSASQTPDAPWQRPADSPKDAPAAEPPAAPKEPPAQEPPARQSPAAEPPAAPKDAPAAESPDQEPPAEGGDDT
jgi:NADH:ubiquinone oxidoreductase subunit C